MSQCGAPCVVNPQPLSLVQWPPPEAAGSTERSHLLDLVGPRKRVLCVGPLDPPSRDALRDACRRLCEVPEGRPADLDVGNVLLLPKVTADT